jgi:type II secretion system protein D
MPRSEGVPIYSREEDLPAGEQVVSFFMPLTYITTEEAVRTFTQVIPSHIYGVVVPVPNASAVIINENSAVIRSLIELKEHVDVPPAQVLNKSFLLERSDAEEVAGILSELLGTQSPSRPGGGTTTRSVPTPTRAPQGGVPGQAAAAAAAAAAVAGQGGGGGASNAESIQPQIVPIVRTNKILAIARPIDMTYIESLIEEFDAPAENKNFLKRRLNYFPVADFLTIASDALSRGLDTGAAGAGVGALGRTTATRTTPTQARQTGTTGAGGIGGTGTGAGGGFSGGLGAEAQDVGVAQSLVVGKTLLIADPQANILIVSGPPENLRVINELLDELDVRSSQIYLSTVIGEMALTEDVDWSLELVQTYSGSNPGGAGSAGGAAAPGLIVDPSSLLTIADFSTGAGVAATAVPAGFYGALDYHDLNLFVQALEQHGNFKVLSRPSVFVRNNAVATIRRGERRPIPTSTFTDTTGGQTSNVDFVDIVLELEVSALINSDEEVTLQIAQVNDGTNENVIIDGNLIPVITTQELQTEITVPDQSTVIIGGLISDTLMDTKSGIPGLVNIPIIGRIFGTTDYSEQRRELLVFMQPHIIDDVSDLVDANVDLTRRTNVAPEALDYALPDPPLMPTELRPESEAGSDAATLQRALEEEQIRRKREAEAAAAEKEGRRWGIFRSRGAKKIGAPGR